MRPPLSAIEPERLGVSMATRGLLASAASRVSGTAGVVPGTGAEGLPCGGATLAVGGKGFGRRCRSSGFRRLAGRSWRRRGFGDARERPPQVLDQELVR